MDKNLVVSIHVQSVDQLKAIKLIKGKITDLDRMKIEEQKKAVRSGYDMEIIPSDLATYGGEAKKILDDLQSRNERISRSRVSRKYRKKIWNMKLCRQRMRMRKQGKTQKPKNNRKTV